MGIVRLGLCYDYNYCMIRVEEVAMSISDMIGMVFLYVVARWLSCSDVT